MAVDIRGFLEEIAQTVERALDGYLSPGHGVPAVLLEAMRYSTLGGGKRFRPAVLLATAGIYGTSAAQALPAACALEMIHTYSLIHDDLPCMDDDAWRRGKPTNHRVYGEAIATLAGDALLTRAFEILAAATPDPAVAVRLAGELAGAAGAAGMVGGQVLDLEAEGKECTVEQLRAIHRLKTGSLIRCAVRLGAIAGRAPVLELAALTAYGEHLGVAFQIMDDILDEPGDQRKGKATYPGLVGLGTARDMARQEIEAAQRSLEQFGERGALLASLAAFVGSRDR